MIYMGQIVSPCGCLARLSKDATFSRDGKEICIVCYGTRHSQAIEHDRDEWEPIIVTVKAKTD